MGQVLALRKAIHRLLNHPWLDASEWPVFLLVIDAGALPVYPLTPSLITAWRTPPSGNRCAKQVPRTRITLYLSELSALVAVTMRNNGDCAEAFHYASLAWILQCLLNMCPGFPNGTKSQNVVSHFVPG